MSAKDVFMKKVADGQLAQQNEQEAVELEKTEYRKKMFSLGKQIKEWLSETSVTVSVESRMFNDDTGFEHGVNRRYEMTYITILNEANTVQISPMGLSFFGSSGLISVRVHTPNRSPSTKSYSLFMRHHTMKGANEWILVRDGNYSGSSKELTEELFFELIADIA